MNEEGLRRQPKTLQNQQMEDDASLAHATDSWRVFVPHPTTTGEWVALGKRIVESGKYLHLVVRR